MGRPGRAPWAYRRGTASTRSDARGQAVRRGGHSRRLLAGAPVAAGDFKIETSTNGTRYKVAATGTFTPNDLGVVNTVAPTAGTTAGVRFVRFTMINPHVFQIAGASCPGPFSGCDFMDMSELEVYGSPS